jgi:DNA repair exonuclease SbcCD ATPase subunit
MEILLDELNKKIMKLKINIEQQDKIKLEYTQKIKEKSILEIIIELLDRDGLVDMILEQKVLPMIENNVNEILEYMTEYKIRIELEKKNIMVKKISNKGAVINIDTLSGCEGFILNIAFRLVLSHYNNNINANMFIIDEAFNYCDDDNINKMSNLFNYMRDNYESTIVISHDERIHEHYDNEIKIDRKNNVSKIII